MSTSTIRPASIARWHDEPPVIESALERTWVARGANFVVTLTQAADGARLVRDDQPDEHMVVLVDCAATFRTGGDTAEVPADSLVIVPPGASELRVHGRGQVLRVFSHRAADLAAVASNAETLEPWIHAAEAAAGAAGPDAVIAGVAPLVPWPAPHGGFRLRHYPLAAHTRADSNMRIFRCTNLMLNVMTPRPVARDMHKLSPHAHADYEQGSLALKGQWVHHLRYPWVPDMTAWRDDEHAEVGSPSLTVIPPKVVHTSRNTNDGGAWLIDIFAPPRLDFASQPGKVANEHDYPLPPDPGPQPRRPQGEG